MFLQIKNRNSELQRGVGIYVVAAKAASGDALPWYVGRTCNELGARIVQHYESNKFRKLLHQLGPLLFFLLPRATHRGHVIVPARKDRRDLVKPIRQLEFALIGTCLNLNPELLNKQEATFHKAMHVPGYIDDGASDRDFSDEQALSKLLKTESYI